MQPCSEHAQKFLLSISLLRAVGRAEARAQIQSVGGGYKPKNAAPRSRLMPTVSMGAKKPSKTEQAKDEGVQVEVPETQVRGC